MTKTIAIAVLLAATAASAQPTPPAPAPGQPAMTEDEKKAKARSLYEEGLKHYNLGEYDSAIAAFKSAYAISSAPGLLFNIAQSYRLKKDYEEASNFYLTYLRLKPDAPNRSDVEQRIEEMNKLLDEQKAMGKRPPEGTVPPEGGSATSSKSKDPTVTVNLMDNRGGRGEGGAGGGSLMTAGYATAGAGAALVITGLVFGRMAKNAEKELNQLSADMGTWTQDEQDLYDAGRRNNIIAIISFVAGGAAVATGATLYIMGTLKKKDASVAVVPGKTGTTVAVGWSF